MIHARNPSLGGSWSVKKIAILPTVMTLGNGVCGFSAIVAASKIDGGSLTEHYFWVSACLVLAAMLFDVLDGFLARLSRTASEFGGQLDSLCDVVSFGVAPAYLILRLGREWDTLLMRNTVSVVAALYLVCVILRLARFNIENAPDPASHRRFKGLPSPAGAGCIVSLAVLRSQSPDNWAGLDPDILKGVVKVWATVGALVVALLMVSRVAYPHLTRGVLRGRRPFSYLLRIVLVVFVLALAQELSVLLIFWGYALVFAMRHLLGQLRSPSRSLSPPMPPAPLDAPPPS